jgi:protein-tyrosine phosphatase
MEPRRILFVCTANVCRSPAAEHLARDFAAQDDRFEFTSAGLLREGLECPDKLVRLLAERGLDLRAHRSRIVDLTTLRVADLVVTMERGHIRELAVMDRSVIDRAVPLLELCRVLGRPRSVAEVRALLAGREPGAYLGLGDHDDVPDPYGRSKRHYRRTVELLAEKVGLMMGNLRP